MIIDRINITLDGREIEIERARLGKYLKMQAIQRRFSDATKKQDSGAMAAALFEFLSTCIDNLDLGCFNRLPWYEVITAYIAITLLNKIPDSERFAVLSSKASHAKKPAWDYQDRQEYTWIHLIAYAYKWTRNVIENLWPEEAVAFLQEIIAEQQAEREFLHSLSELAYPYNASTKKSTYRPLHKPLWMVEAKDVKKTLILREFLPVGIVQYPEEDEDYKEFVH